MASETPRPFQVTHNQINGLVTIVLGKETAALLFAAEDAVEFACEILQHSGGKFSLHVEFPDGRASIDCDHDAPDCPHT